MMTTLTKMQTLKMLQDDNVKSTNIRTFLSKNKKFNFPPATKMLIWLKVIEIKRDKVFWKEENKRIAKGFGLSVTEYKMLKTKAFSVLEAFNTGHSMGCHKFVHINNTIFARKNETFEYSISSKYRANHGNVNIHLNKTELRNIELIHNIWTIKGKNHTAKWLESTGNKGSYQVNLVKGFIFGKSHGDTLLEAKATFKKSLMLQQRENLGNDKFIGLEHIKGIGACNAGIKAFIQKHNLNIDMGYNLGYLKSLEHSSFLNRL